MYQNCLSPHQLPLARELAQRLGDENFRYVFRSKVSADRINIGWDSDSNESWVVDAEKYNQLATDLIEHADNLLTMFRDVDLIERRCNRGLTTFYDSERWLKPVLLSIPFCNFCFNLPGWLKLLSPKYFRMFWRMTAMLRKYSNFFYLPIGPHAEHDMSLFGVPRNKMIPWGYFVDASSRPEMANKTWPVDGVKLLYIGRFLKLKRIDTIIRAVAYLNAKQVNGAYTLSIVGDGPEKSYLEKLAHSVAHASAENIAFHPSVPIREVRQLMRSHDILVFASGSYDGWGAVVSESLSEGVPVIGTYETGASAALLPETQLFHCGDYKELAAKILPLHHRKAVASLPFEYTPPGAAERILHYAKTYT